MNVTAALNKHFVSKANLHLNFREFISQYSELIYENIKLLNTDNIPQVLMFDTLKLEIQKTNEKISILESNHFWVRPIINDDYFWDSIFVNDIVGRFANKKLIETYNNIRISNVVSREVVQWLREKSIEECPHEINFPLFDELISYIALLKYYNKLLVDLEYIEQKQKQKHKIKSTDSTNLEISKSNTLNPTTINNMENELFDKLHIYSLNIQNIPINETTIEKIIYLNDELFEDEFKIADNYLLQKAIVDSKDSAVDLVLKNLDIAINTNCGNDIDFSDISSTDICEYGYSTVPGETSINKKYKDIWYKPEDFQVFRRIWLRNFIEEIKEVRNAIYTIVGKPLIEPTIIVADPNKNDIDIDRYAANLGHCISIATRWDMKAIKNTITDNTPYSVFTPNFDKYHELFNNFKKALRIEFDNPQNGKGFEIDMINRFSNMINLYYNWYEEHKEETKIFDPYNPYEYIYGFVKEAELELKKYFKFEITKTNSVDVFSIINEYEDFSESTKARVNAIFDSNIEKTQKLDTYFKEIFPEYISETNNLLSTLQEMENSFKSTIPALTDDHNKLVSINAKFKTQIFESIEKMFYKISEIDSNRFYSEYFEAINFLETRLELNNKQIASFFKTLEKRLKQLKENHINSTIAHTDKKIIPKIKPTIDRTIKESEFENYFKPTLKGMGENKINHFANLVEDLKLNRTAREFAQIALLIYESQHLNNRRPPHFSQWYKIFCECVGCERKKYDPKDLRPIRKNVLSLFSYLLD